MKWIAAAAFIVALVAIGGMERQDAEAERAHYCDMVATYHETGGEYGWPPYDGECE